MRWLMMTAVLFGLFTVAHAADNGVADALRPAREFALTHMTEPKLFHVSGQSLFDSTGNRVGPIKHSFVGKSAEGKWTILKVWVRPDMTIDYLPEKHGPFPAHWKEYDLPELQLLKWVEPSEALRTAVAQYPQYAPAFSIPMTYAWSTRLGGRYAMMFHWIVKEKLVDVTIAPETGEVLEKMVSSMTR